MQMELRVWLDMQSSAGQPFGWWEWSRGNHSNWQGSRGGRC